MANLKEIAAALAILSAGTLTLSGCKKEETVAPDGGDGEVKPDDGAAEGEAAADGEASCSGEKTEGAEGEASCSGEAAADGAAEGEASCSGEKT